jgi:nicotinamide riboside transporter PnuC
MDLSICIFFAFILLSRFVFFAFILFFLLFAWKKSKIKAKKTKQKKSKSKKRNKCKKNAHGQIIFSFCFSLFHVPFFFPIYFASGFFSFEVVFFDFPCFPFFAFLPFFQFQKSLE